MNDTMQMAEIFRLLDQAITQPKQPTQPSYWERSTRNLEKQITDFCKWFRDEGQFTVHGKDASELERKVMLLGREAGFEMEEDE